MINPKQAGGGGVGRIHPQAGCAETVSSRELTEWKLRTHARKCEKAFTCSLEQYLSTAGNILYFVVLLAMHSDLNSYFKHILNT